MLDGVSINQLRAFVAVCDETSFSRAARKLGRAQSAISHAIGALESALGVSLFERGGRRPELSTAGRDLLTDARAVIARTEEMKNRARSIADAGAQSLSIAIDTYFPRERLIRCLQEVQRSSQTTAITIRITTMQGGEKLVLAGTCSLAVTVDDVPALNPSAIERHWLCDTSMVTVCAPSHPLVQMDGPVPLDELTRFPQIVVTDNQPETEKSQRSVAGERNWFVDGLNTKHDFLRAGLGWGHMPVELVAADLASGDLVEIERRAWHFGPISFMVSRLRGHAPSGCELKIIRLLADDRGSASGGDLPPLSNAPDHATSGVR